MDGFLAEIREKIGKDDDTVAVRSSRTTASATSRRCVNLNSWLRDEGYLVLKEGKTTSGDYFAERRLGQDTRLHRSA